MGRTGISYLDVAQAAETLQRQGQIPTIEGTRHFAVKLYGLV